MRNLLLKRLLFLTTMLIVLGTSTVFASEIIRPELKIDKMETVESTDIAGYSLSITNSTQISNEGIQAFKLALEYDKTALDLSPYVSTSNSLGESQVTNFEVGQAFKNLTDWKVVNPVVVGNKITIIAYSTTSISSRFGDTMEVGTLFFKKVATKGANNIPLKLVSSEIYKAGLTGEPFKLEVTPAPIIKTGPSPYNESMVINTNLVKEISDKYETVKNNLSSLSDIEGHEYKAPILAMYRLGIINGYPDHTFRPDDSITRAEFATLMKYTFQFNEGYGEVPDDTKGHWAESTMLSLKTVGLLSGFPDGTFRPNAQITRAEAVAIIERLLRSELTTLTSTPYTDAESSWAKNSIIYVTNLGLIKGHTSTEFNPGVNITRGETADLLYNVLKLSPDARLD